jgi:soluble lytic murein transglycosylase
LNHVLRATVAIAAGLCAATIARPQSAGQKAPSTVKVLGQAYQALGERQFARAVDLGQKAQKLPLLNPDYADYVVGQAAFMLGDYALAGTSFRALSGRRGSRFAGVASWRLADCDWRAGRQQEAKARYQELLERRGSSGDRAVARFRVAQALALAGSKAAAVKGFREVVERHPDHPLADAAHDQLHAMGEPDALEPGQRLARAELLTDARLWREAVAELDKIGDEVSVQIRRQRDFQLGRTLFKMRRQYGLAGTLLLSVYPHMGDNAAWALFHGARGLSRADRDLEAIKWYQQVIAKYPRSDWADEAQYLTGWLQFNLGNYQAAIEPLEITRKRFPRSKLVADAIWYQGLSHYLLGQYEPALDLFATLAKAGDRLEGGKGRYWRARTLQKLQRSDEAITEFRELVGAYPFSWYALLARARLKELGQAISPFGDAPRASSAALVLPKHPPQRVTSGPLLRRVDELLRAGLPDDAAAELQRGERAVLGKYGRADGLAALLDRYQRAGNFNRPWVLAVVHGGRAALEAPPTGPARVWWQHAYPLAYRPLIERWRKLGGAPAHYLYSIMRKESGFNPHIVSYADAIGLLQMIPPTTRRVVAELDMEYTDDFLFDPAHNIKVGSWYIGRLLKKFKGQVPIAAASYNAGPAPVMRWLDAYGERPVDEYVELIPFHQARGYGKKVTETYARYRYLYNGEIYEQPLAIDRDYVRDDLTY